jgi:heme oxygenase (biliverdin-IX-beta and delta-forming)
VAFVAEFAAASESTAAPGSVAADRALTRAIISDGTFLAKLDPAVACAVHTLAEETGGARRGRRLPSRVPTHPAKENPDTSDRQAAVDSSIHPQRHLSATQLMFRPGHPDDLGGKGNGQPPVHAPLHLRLRRETAHDHETLERRLHLLEPDLSVQRYRLVLQSFHGFYASVEDELLRLAATTPPLGFPLRTRTELLERDLLALGLSRSDIAALPRCANLPRLRRTEHLAGCLYVLEGACLGGQVIVNALRGRLPITSDRGLSFFVGDGSKTGARWQLVLAWLEDLVRRGALADEIVASACETFCSLGTWLELMGATR